jgi:hypothetical protein
VGVEKWVHAVLVAVNQAVVAAKIGLVGSQAEMMEIVVSVVNLVETGAPAPELCKNSFKTSPF